MRGMLRRPLLAGLLLVLGLMLLPAGCAVMNATGLGQPRRDIDAQIALLAPHAQIHHPESVSGPAPAVIFFHGCGGVRPFFAEYASQALAAGYAVIIIDSLQARGISRRGGLTQVCTGLRLWGQERAADVAAAVALARRDRRIDADRLALAGWSHGAWAIMEAMDAAAAGEAPRALADEAGLDLDGVRAAFLFYPYCSFPMNAGAEGLASGPPIAAILGEDDVVARPAACARLFDRARAQGGEIDYSVWDDLTHAFDEERDSELDPRFRYDAGSARRAHEWLVAGLLERV